jgi:hypothetical protein
VRLTSHRAFIAVRAAIKAGLVVHAPHADFGGVLTVSQSRRADGSIAWEAIQHGGTVDVGFDEPCPSAIARYFVSQVGKWSAACGVVRAYRKATQ